MMPLGVILGNALGLCCKKKKSLSIIGTAIPGRLEAESYFAAKWVDTQSTQDVGGGLNVGWTDPGDWIEYEITVMQSGTYSLTIRYASQNDGLNLELSVDGTSLLTAVAPATGGWQTWEDYNDTISLTRGNSILRLDCIGGGMNLNYFDFTLI
jgi:hypothetical protein